MIFINNEIDDLLKRGIEYSKNASRDMNKTGLLIIIYEILKAYFNKESVEVVLSFDKNFKDFASIFIRGNDIKIFDKRILKMLNEHVSYYNLYIEDGKTQYELTFSGLLNRKMV